MKHIFLYNKAYKSCIRKKKYRDYFAAQEAKQEIYLKYKKLMSYYHCKFCEGFHLTTK